MANVINVKAMESSNEHTMDVGDNLHAVTGIVVAPRKVREEIHRAFTGEAKHYAISP